MIGSRILVGICLVLVLLSSGCITLSGVDGKPLDLEQRSDGVVYFMEEIPPVIDENAGKTLKAMVKGSVYESGEAVTVFGTCLDGDDGIINGTYATMASWYPNGTVFFAGVSMTEMSPGYFMYQGSMNAVQGTYLTEITCRINGSSQFALAWGEWQNPVWVQKISDINASVEITWDKLDSINVTLGNVYTNLSQEIYVVGQIANASVDRNDSYVVYLLNQIINTTTPPSSGDPVSWTEDADVPVYMRYWTIRVYPYDSSTGRSLSYPDVMCDIETDLPSPNEDMDVEGNHFKYKLRITRIGDFNWIVNCYWL